MKNKGAQNDVVAQFRVARLFSTGSLLHMNIVGTSIIRRDQTFPETPEFCMMSSLAQSTESQASHSMSLALTQQRLTSSIRADLEANDSSFVKESKVSVLPENKTWPFLLRFPVSSFGMCLGLNSQAILWKTLATAPSMKFLHVSLKANLILWCFALALTFIVFLVYILKIIYHFEAVKREYYHPIRINFFFAPWLACLFLALGVPPLVTENLHPSLWYVLMAPILCLELIIYGQWIYGGHCRLSHGANPSSHLSIAGNFVGALLGASMGLKEEAIFFFAVGLAHYIVLFITLFQKLPTNQSLPKELHPVFFLFVVAPNIACLAWAKIQGHFDYASKFAYFVAVSLYVCLAVRLKLFRGFRFSLAWWAYTFPLTSAPIATIWYSSVVENVLTRTAAVALSSISTFALITVFVFTVIHGLVLHDLFPNDISIGITEKGPKRSKKLSYLKSMMFSL